MHNLNQQTKCQRVRQPSDAAATELRWCYAVRQVLRTLHGGCLTNTGHSSADVCGPLISDQERLNAVQRRIITVAGRKKNPQADSDDGEKSSSVSSCDKGLVLTSSYKKCKYTEIFRNIVSDCRRVNMRSSCFVRGRGEQINWKLSTLNNPWKLVSGKLWTHYNAVTFCILSECDENNRT